MTQEIPIRVDASEFRIAVDDFVAAAEDLSEAADQLSETEVHLYEDGELQRTMTSHEIFDITVDVSIERKGEPYEFGE